MNKKEIEKDINYLFNLEKTLSHEDKEKLFYLSSPKRNKSLFDLKNKKLGSIEVENILKNNKEYYDDYEIMLESVKRYGYLLKYASDRLKNNEEIVLSAVKENGYTLKYASKRLKDNYNIALEAVKQDGDSLFYASDRLRDNEKIVLMAIKDDKSSLEFASERLKEKYKK